MNSCCSPGQNSHKIALQFCENNIEGNGGLVSICHDSFSGKKTGVFSRGPSVEALGREATKKYQIELTFSTCSQHLPL